tara:strand:- start:71 stop:385 length:315 start_codon:yes stop_codon:yes gene_type:complete
MTRAYVTFNDQLVERLKDPEEAEWFFDQALSEYEGSGNISAFMLCLRYLAEANGGLAALAQKTGLNKQNLYKILTGKTTPKFDTIFTIIHGLGFQIRSHHYQPA